MVLFTDLPNELLHRMLSFLDLAGLARVSRVTRHLQLIAEPFLYERVGLNTMHGDTQLIEHFLYAVLARPALANYVRTLTLQWHDEIATTFPSHITLFAAAASRFDLEMDFFHNAHAKLLLYHLPRLQSIDLAPPKDIDLFDLHLYSGRPTSLPYLRNLTCYWGEIGRTMHLSSFLALLALPHIDTLDVRLQSDLEPPGFNFIPIDIAGTSSLTDLTLSFGYLKPESIERILKIPRELTRFSFTHLPLDHNFDGPELGCSLQRSVGHSLQFLEMSWGIETDWELSQPNTDLGAHFTIGSLLEWPVLRSIRCSLTVLLGRGPRRTAVNLVNVLPRVLCELEIEQDQYWSLPEIVDVIVDMLLQRREEWLQQLLVVTVPRVVEEVGVGRLRRACAEAGVRMALSESLGSPYYFGED